MPYISIESGKLTAEQKKQLIERLTATASEITHIPEQFFTVTIKELPDEKFFAKQSAKAMMRYSPEESRLTLRQLLKNFRKNVSQSEEKLFEGKPV